MAEENTQATSTEQSSSTTQQTQQTTQQETTLEDVYKTHNVEQMANEFSAKRTTETQRETSTQRPEAAQDLTNLAIPDPTLQPTEYKAYEARKARELHDFRQALTQVSGQLTNMQRAAMQQVEEADIRKTVDTVNEHLGDAKLDPDIVEIALGAEARKDPRFLTVWQNRTKNPKAFQEAVKAFSGKLGKKFAMRADPQIAENQRALREATSTKATTAPEPSQEEKLGKLQGAAFRKAMDDIKNGRTPQVG